jgi:hypothetical protein
MSILVFCFVTLTGQTFHRNTVSPSLGLKMKAVCFSETLIFTYKFTRRHSPEDQLWRLHCRESKTAPLHAMEALGGRVCIASIHSWPQSASLPIHALPPGKGPPNTHCTGGSVGPRAGLNAVISFPWILLHAVCYLVSIGFSAGLLWWRWWTFRFLWNISLLNVCS